MSPGPPGRRKTEEKTPFKEDWLNNGNNEHQRKTECLNHVHKTEVDNTSIGNDTIEAYDCNPAAISMPYSVHKNCGINITEICFKSERGLSFIVTSRNRTSKCKIFKETFLRKFQEIKDIIKDIISRISLNQAKKNGFLIKDIVNHLTKTQNQRKEPFQNPVIKPELQLSNLNLPCEMKNHEFQLLFEDVHKFKIQLSLCGGEALLQLCNKLIDIARKFFEKRKVEHVSDVDSPRVLQMVFKKASLKNMPLHRQLYLFLEIEGELERNYFYEHFDDEL